MFSIFRYEPNFAFMKISTFRTLAFVAFAVITTPLFSQGTCEIEGLFGPPAFECGDTQEYDGYDYATVQIGDQCWFQENLRNTHYANGEEIPDNIGNGVSQTGSWDGGINDCDGNNLWTQLTTGASAIYGETPSCGSMPGYDDYCGSTEVALATFGRLYNSIATQDVRGLCPAGWHVPTDVEFEELLGYVASNGYVGNEGYALTSDLTWSGFGGNDHFEFAALAAGIRAANCMDGDFGYAGAMTVFLCSGTDGTPYALNFWAGQSAPSISPGYGRGASVRCAQDFTND
jgi:uncharacterized protein (TIGR02145 family)